MNTELQLKHIAAQIRIETLKIIYRGKASHIGGAFSMVDILTVLYNDVLNIDPTNPKWEVRDRFLLSKGHACSSLYVTLALKGFFPLSDLESYGKNGSIYLSHASHLVPGVEFSTGSLGHALPVGCGLALAAKKKNKGWRTFVLVSDGELDEGSNWEAILFAPQHKLDNLILIVDYNKIQSLGDVKDVIDLHPILDKFKAFNWEVVEIEGHDYNQICHAFKNLPITKYKPHVIIAHTIKGKGVDFMENKLIWHYKSPSEEEYKIAIKQLENSL